MGISQSMILRYENAWGNPPQYLFPKFAKAFEIPKDQWFGLENAIIERKELRL